MVSWIGERTRRIELPKRLARPAVPATRVEFGELTPETLPYLGQAAYIQMELFEQLARAVSTAPTLRAKEGVSTSARFTLKKHHKLIAEIRAFGAEPEDVMMPFAPAIDAFRAATTGSDWYELLLTSHITSGILDDFFIRLAGALPAEVGSRVAAVISRRPPIDMVAAELRSAIAADDVLGSRLAMWGRRLVGDTLLVARSALHESNAHGPVDEAVEPVFTELVAAHTRRMDDLGLTA